MFSSKLVSFESLKKNKGLDVTENLHQLRSMLNSYSLWQTFDCQNKSKSIIWQSNKVNSLEVILTL